MTEQTHNTDMSDEPDRQDLEDRVDQLESTIAKMLPSRRDALKLGGAALVGGAAMSGTASAGDESEGTIGTSGAPVDIESEDINNADTVTTDTLDSTTVDNSGTVTTQDLVVNGTATGPFGGGAPVLEAGDSITVEAFADNNTDETFVTLYDGSAKDVLGGTILGAAGNADFLYTFADSSTIHKNGTGTTYTFGNISVGKDLAGDNFEVDFLPPALDVTKIEVGTNTFSNATLAAEVILKD